MIIITYDISDNKLRTKFAKFLEKNGIRLQFSVFEISNSTRVLNNVQLAIENRFSKSFSENDSIMIIPTSNEKMVRYGNAKNQIKDFISI